MYHKYFPTQFDESFSFKKIRKVTICGSSSQFDELFSKCNVFEKSVKLQISGAQVNLTDYFRVAISLKNSSTCNFRELKSF